MKFTSYILSNPKEVCENLKSAQINIFEHSTMGTLLVTYQYEGLNPVTEHGIAKGLRGCKNIFTRDWGKGAKWIADKINFHQATTGQNYEVRRFRESRKQWQSNGGNFLLKKYNYGYK